MDIIDLITDPALLGPYFQGSSWDRWGAVSKATYGLPMTDRELELFHEVAGDRAPPSHPVSEVVIAAGRGAGKDAISSAFGTYEAINLDPALLRPGERGTVMIIANSKDQASISAAYLAAYFERVPLLAQMVERISADEVLLKNGAEIIVIPNSLRAPRGRRIICAILNEVGTWRSDESATPDHEVDAAVTPGLVRHLGAKKILISSPYRRVGLLYERYTACFGVDDPNTLALLGTSLQFNPTLDPAIIERELQKDRARAGAEYLAEWRDDLSGFVDRALVEELIDRGVHERPYNAQIHTYRAFADESGGAGGDRSTLAICHTDQNGDVIQDLIRIWKPPFSPSAVIAEKCRILESFRLRKIIGDSWAGGLVPDLYGSHGVYFEQTTTTKSAFYLDFLHLLHSRRILMLEEPTQIAELLALERRVNWGGRETVDHPQIAQAHDDAVNALAGAAVIAAAARPSLVVGPELRARLASGGAFVPPQQPPPGSAAPAAPQGRLFISAGLRARLNRRPPAIGRFSWD